MNEWEAQKAALCLIVLIFLLPIIAILVGVIEELL